MDKNTAKEYSQSIQTAKAYRQPTAPARNTISKASKTPHYCWYSVRVAQNVV